VRDEGHNWQPFGGKCRQKCSICGEIEEKHEIAPVEGKCEEKCSICGASRTLPHRWSGAKCKRCGELKAVWRTRSWFPILWMVLFFAACLLAWRYVVGYLLIPVLPIGLIGLHAMWKYQLWHKYVKAAVTVVFGAVVLLCVIRAQY